MGIIIGNEPIKVVQVEQPVAVEAEAPVVEAVSDVQQPVESDVPVEDAAPAEEPKKPVKRSRRRK